MDWLELTIQTTAEGIDLLSEQLTMWGFDSFIIEDETQYQTFLDENKQYWDYVDEDLMHQIEGLSQIRLYLEPTPEANAQTETLRRLLAELKAQSPDDRYGSLELAVASVRDEDWENNWKQYYQRMDVSEKLTVVPCWMDPDPNDPRIPLFLDPGLIFGTGAHASTQLCLQALEKAVKGGETVVDLGCGSGILSIAALLLGASRAAGVDIDPLAPKVAIENAARNNLHEDVFTAFAGNVLEDDALIAQLSGCDILLANIVADVIIPLAPIAAGMLKPNGIMICSGVLLSRADEVKSALAEAGFVLTNEVSLNDWCCFTAELCV